MNKFKIAVDAGHGSDTLGKRTPGMPRDIDLNEDGKVDVSKGMSIREHIANVGVAIFLIDELERCGFEVIKTGFDDSDSYDDDDTALSKRQQMIKAAGCDYSISIHFNAYGDGRSFNSAQGIEVLIHDRYQKDSEALAMKVLKHIVHGTSQKNRGVKEQSLAMCNCKVMNTKASILVECAFMTNLNEAVSMMGNDDYWEETAIEITKGICDYTKTKYQPEVEKETEAIVTMYHRVQVGAFRHKLKGDAMVERVKAAGFIDAFSKTTFLDGLPLYRVQIGAFTKKSNAEIMLTKVKAAGFEDAFISIY